MDRVAEPEALMSWGAAQLWHLLRARPPLLRASKRRAPEARQPTLPAWIPGPGLGFHTLPLPEEVQVTWCELGQEQQCSQSQQKELHGWKWPKVRLQVRGDGKANGAGLRPPRLEVPLFSRNDVSLTCPQPPTALAPTLPEPRVCSHPLRAGPPPVVIWAAVVGWGGRWGQAPRSKVLPPTLSCLHRATARGRHARGTQKGRGDFTQKVPAPAGEPNLASQAEEVRPEAYVGVESEKHDVTGGKPGKRW